MKVLFKLIYCGLTLLICMGLFACNDEPKQSEINTHSTAPVNRQQQIKQEAQADAQQAILGQDLRLLALRNKGTSIPGVNLENHELATLEQLCGLLFMQHSGDEILHRSELNVRQEQYVYALIYNNVVLPACLEQNPNNVKK